MLSRRREASALVLAPALLTNISSLAQQVGDEVSPNSFDQLIYPLFGAINQPGKSGYSKPTQAQRDN